MLKRVLIPILAIMLLAQASLAQAADGSSGCGPAWYILKQNSLVSSSLRTMTNGMVSPIVTFGMTLGTSNCAKHSIVENDKEAEHLVTVTFDKLRQDVAQGQGEFLNAYADTFKCQEDAKELFRKTLQANYAVIFVKDVNAEAIVESTRKVVSGQVALAGRCDAA